MKRTLTIVAALAVALAATTANAAEKLVVSSWGGSWKDLIAETVAKKFTADTGVEVEFVTGGTIDRLNKAKLAKGEPESDVTFTTSHVGLSARPGAGRHEVRKLGRPVEAGAEGKDFRA